jgi:hypothetical protein
MWQQIIAGILVIAAAIYAARALGPRSWRRKARGADAKGAADPGSCGCGKDDGGCH